MVTAHLDQDDITRLKELRRRRPARHAAAAAARDDRDLGQRLSDRVAALVGSWPFIAIQGGLIVLWIAANGAAWALSWDPYPFILLNLALSFQAAFTAPIIMMSQNRQAEIDRRAARQDYAVNEKAELEIEALHTKLDLLREQQVIQLTQMVERLFAKIEHLEDAIAGRPSPSATPTSA